MSELELEGGVALITGGSRGIGAAIAQRLGAAGCRIALTYLNSPVEAQQVGRSLMDVGVEPLLLKADLSVDEDVQQVVEIVTSELGGLDVLVSNAAGGGFRPLAAVTPDNFDYAMSLNARAFMRLVQHATPHLTQREGRMPRSRVLCISSWGAERALPMYGAIGASKAALEALTRHFALELGPQGVNVNCIRAGVVDTKALRELPGVDLVLGEREKRSLVEGRNVAPEDVANVALFLTSPLSDMIQGQTVIVDGGTSLHP